MASSTGITASEYIDTLRSRGHQFDGGDETSRREIAEEWLDYFGDRIETATRYMDVGVWDALTANILRVDGIDPADLEDFPEDLVEGMDTIYALCNGDISLDRIRKAMA